MRFTTIIILLGMGACRPAAAPSTLAEEGDTTFRVSLANRLAEADKESFDLVYSVEDVNGVRKKMIACVNVEESACVYDCDDDDVFCGTYLGTKGGRSFFKVPAVLSENIVVVAKVFAEAPLERVTFDSVPADTWTHKFRQIGEGSSEDDRQESSASAGLALRVVKGDKCSNGSCHGSAQAGFDTLSDQRKSAIRSRVRNGSMPPAGSPRLTEEEKSAIQQW